MERSGGQGKPVSKWALVVLGLFALPFAGVGTLAGSWCATSVWEAVHMRSWVAVPAELHGVELNANSSGSKATHRVEARYSYLWQGETYSGERVSIHSGFDNLGSYQKSTYRSLRMLQGRAGKFQVYVNPARPQESIIDRNPRLERLGFYLIFFLVFGGVGYGLLIGAWIGTKRLREEVVRQSHYPAEPWLWKREWEGGRVRSMNRRNMLGAFIFAGFWNAISAPILFLLPKEALAKKNYAAFVGLLLPLIGAGLLVWCIRLIWHWRKFGDSVLELETFPGAIGGRLQGKILTAIAGEISTCSLQLTSIHEEVRGSGKSRSRSERILWQKTHNLNPGALGRGMKGAVFPVDFSIPADCAPCEERGPENRVFWRLSLAADVPGLDYEGHFEVPVYVTGEAFAHTAKNDAESSPYVLPVTLEEILRSERLRHRLRSDGGESLITPRMRRPGSALTVSGIFLVWSAIVGAMVYGQAPRFILFGFGLLEALLFLALLDQWFYRSELQVNGDEVSFHGGILPGRRRRWRRQDLQGLRVVSGVESGKRGTFAVEVIPKEGKPLRVLRDLQGPESAQILVDHMKGILGL